MKKMYIISILTILLVGCRTSNKAVSYLRACHASDLYIDHFYLTTLDELKENLSQYDNFRYVGSDENYHYLLHFYDKTTKIQTGFKVPLSNISVTRVIDFEKNLSYKRENNKYEDGYLIKLTSL